MIHFFILARDKTMEKRKSQKQIENAIRNMV